MLENDIQLQSTLVVGTCQSWGRSSSPRTCVRSVLWPDSPSGRYSCPSAAESGLRVPAMDTRLHASIFGDHTSDEVARAKLTA